MCASESLGRLLACLCLTPAFYSDRHNVYFSYFFPPPPISFRTEIIVCPNLDVAVFFLLSIKFHDVSSFFSFANQIQWILRWIRFNNEMMNNSNDNVNTTMRAVDTPQFIAFICVFIKSNKRQFFLDFQIKPTQMVQYTVIKCLNRRKTCGSKEKGKRIHFLWNFTMLLRPMN